jgi:hypothetical protein
MRALFLNRTLKPSSQESDTMTSDEGDGVPVASPIPAPPS